MDHSWDKQAPPGMQNMLRRDAMSASTQMRAQVQKTAFGGNGYGLLFRL